jgi:hypothetical protein
MNLLRLLRTEPRAILLFNVKHETCKETAARTGRKARVCDPHTAYGFHVGHVAAGDIVRPKVRDMYIPAKET